MKVSDVVLQFVDEDHVWINGKQYISLRRFGDVVNNKMTAEEVTDLVDEHLTNKNTCIRCLRQGCQYKNGTVRIHCPLYKSSAV